MAKSGSLTKIRQKPSELISPEGFLLFDTLIVQQAGGQLSCRYLVPKRMHFVGKYKHLPPMRQRRALALSSANTY